MRWTNTHEINVHWFKHIGKEFPIDRVAWDTKLEFGQTRPLDDSHVQRLMNSFRTRPPREPMKVTVWENEGDNKLYLVSSQHVVKAMQKLKEERESEGLPLERYHEVVRADVLKYLTPVDARKAIS